MIKYTIRRLLMMIPVLLGVTFLSFAIAQFTPGDPARLILGKDATQAEVEQFREMHGMNDPFLVKYGRFLWDVLHGDMGTSYRSAKPVLDEILQRFPSTLQLTLASLLLAILMGIPMGAIAAISQRKWVNIATMLFAIIGLSIPGFWLGILLLIVFGVKLGWISVLGGVGVKNLILPAFAVALSSAGTLARLTRSNIMEILQDDFVRTARAKGLWDRLVLMRHVLPNALITVVTVLGMQLAFMLGGAVFIEMVFSRPGLGRYAVQAIAERDYPAVQGMVLFTAVIFAFMSLVVDLIYAYLDPRIRYD